MLRAFQDPCMVKYVLLVCPNLIHTTTCFLCILGKKIMLFNEPLLYYAVN